MHEQTINPFIMFGSYAGLLAGILLSLRGWHIFWWLPPLLGINLNTLIAADAAGGFIAGYILQILWQIASYHTARIIGNKK